MAPGALIGSAKPRTAKAKARVSKALSEHAVAISWWSPASQPGWLTEVFYLREIAPKLKGTKIREIAAALQISQPYAAEIRKGRRRPHPRHWQRLAELVGGSDSQA
jgi:hypothetical protein